MKILVLNALLLLIGLQHLLFMWLEMWAWDKPLGRRVFGLDADFARQSKTLALNQGLYNGFLAAGLLWSAFSNLMALKLFFLICVFAAGVVGGLTAGRRIFWIQGFPAMLGLILLSWLTHLGGW